jgi:hypothetical protein
MTRYRCSVCKDYDLCQKCLEAEKIKILKSLNHTHLFKEWAASSNEECYGIHFFGKCKSDNDETRQLFKCVEDCFYLCRNCIEEPLRKKCITSHHKHSLLEYFHPFESISCFGNYIFGECKSVINKKKIEIMYYCEKCDSKYNSNYFICLECLNAPKPIKYKSMNHKHNLVQVTKKNDTDICCGKYLFGKCKSNEREIKTFYKCIKCSDNDHSDTKYFGYKDYLLCEICLKEPETKKYFSQYHDHPFRKYFHKGYWNCDGIEAFENIFECKVGLDQNKPKDEHNRYMCVECDYFDLCDGCMNEKFKSYEESLPDLSFLFIE